jgi:hypothetical protein
MSSDEREIWGRRKKMDPRLHGDDKKKRDD